jgi:polyphosphate kinase 2 (PPK2 family)
MVIIFEGCNKGGKTTLINKLLEDFKDLKFKVIKCSQPKDGDAYKEYSNILTRIEKDKTKNYILDRFHYGSYVYGPIYRGKPDFSLDKFIEIEERIINLENILVLALPTITFMKKKFIEDKEEFAKIDLIKQERDLFIKAIRISRLTPFIHSLPKKDIYKELKNIIQINISI